MIDTAKRKKIIQVSSVVVISIVIGAIWLMTLKYNLQGGLRKKINTAIPVQADRPLNEIEEKIKTLKENFKINQEQINKLIEQQK